MYIMNEPEASPWLSHIQNTTADSGHYVVQDGISLEWKKVGIQSPDFSLLMKSVSDLALEICPALEVDFLRAHPEASNEDSFLKSCAPLFGDGLEAVDWLQVEDKIRGIFKGLYEADLSRYPVEAIKPLLKDIYFFVIAKDPVSGKLLGFTTFSATPALPYGDMKIIHVVMRQREYERDLDQHLVNSILKIVPDAKRIFLGIRPTNGLQLHSLQSLGFVPDTQVVQDPNHKFNPDHWTLLEKRI